MDWKPPYGLIWSNEDGIGNRENNWMIIGYEKTIYRCGKPTLMALAAVRTSEPAPFCGYTTNINQQCSCRSKKNLLITVEG